MTLIRIQTYFCKLVFVYDDFMNKLLLAFLIGALVAHGQVKASVVKNKEYQMSVENYHRYVRQAQEVKSPEKEVFVEKYRQDLYEADTQYYVVKDKYALPQLKDLLQLDGRFADLDDNEIGPKGGNMANSGGVISEAYFRIWFMAHAFRKGELSFEADHEVWKAFQRAIVHYGELEISRKNDWQRFHASCFAIPRAAVFTYFCLLPQMEAVETGKVRDELLSEACDMLKTVALQTWTQPYRNDFTDENVVQVERFRNHVWWMGGNGLGTSAYRSVFPVAFMLRSIPMIDLLVEVCGKSISFTSQATYDSSFWKEGLTADGAGWGHGRQCLVWRYPIDGTSGALEMLATLKNSPWKTRLTQENRKALLNYFRGSNFYYYKGYVVPCVDRTSMEYRLTASFIPFKSMLNSVLKNWSDVFTGVEKQELEMLAAQCQSYSIEMEAYGGLYNGTRYFFNNDDLIKKNKRYHVMVNMASSRCDGIESADGFADAYNFYTTDGSTLFQKSGDEYCKIFGRFDVTAFPGVTAREGMESLVPVTNWRGYCSKYNFAGGATAGGENAVAGYIFEKMNASDKDGVNDKGNNHGMNSVLYGVKAYKSYFMLGDYTVALGAGITNQQPEMEGHIRTTLDQTVHSDSVYRYEGKKGVEWVVQRNKFAYSVFPEYSNRFHYVCEKKKTDWVKMNRANKGKKGLPEEVDILRLWIDHGVKPKNDTYGYVVYCGEGTPAQEYPFEVLRNDTLIQSVKLKDGNTLEAVFYNCSDVLTDGQISLSVSAPCVVLIEKQTKGWRFSVTDALMNPDCKEIELMWNGKKLVFPMPQAEYLGKPVVLTFE